MADCPPPDSSFLLQTTSGAEQSNYPLDKTMKQSCHLRPALLAAFLPFTPALHAAIPVNGTTTYTQNFDTLPTAPSLSQFDWTDDVTLQGFYLHRSNAPAATNNLAGTLAVAGSRPYVASGSVQVNGVTTAPTSPNYHGFQSLGAYSSTERSLGFCPTTNDGGTNWAGGTLSTIALFTNTGTSTVDLTNMAFNLEVVRANSDATVSETIPLTYKRGTAAALIAELQTYSANAAFQGNGYTTVDAALDHTEADGFTATLGTSISKTATLATPIRLAPGQSVALRWANTNDGGTDALVGIDDLSVTFTQLNASIVPAVSNVVRDNAGTPLDPNDDTISFSLTAQGLGAVSSGWKILSPAAFASTGSYGTPKTISGIPILDFVIAPHSLNVVVEDATVAGVSESFTVTAPWCTLTGSAGAFVYNENGTPDDAGDDTVDYLLTATGTYTGAEYNVTPLPANVAYGNSGSVTGAVPGAHTHVFTDLADTACQSTVVLRTPQIIGINALSGAPANLKSVADFTDRRWTIDGTARTATQVSATQADHTILSEVLDLSAVGWVTVTAELDAIAGTDTITANSSGFEALDHFLLDVIVDGGAPQSILGAGDVNGNGQLDGAAGIGTELPGAGEALVDTQKVVKSYSFSAFIPPSANTLQVRAIGNSNSGNETFIFKNLRIAAAQPSLQAVPGSGVVFNNKGTVDPFDDTVDMPVFITPINLGASTGWTSNLSAPDGPSAKNYTEPNPVLFSVAATATPSLVELKDNLDSSKTASFTVPALPRTFTATLAATPNIVRNENGPGVADDTVSFDITVTGANGGPQFAMATDPGTVSAPSFAITSTGNTVRATISAVPALGGTVYVRIWDASYPVAPMVNLAVAVPAPADLPTEYVIGKKNLGAGLTDVLSLTGDTPAAWQNYPSLPALFMINGGASTIVTSEEINLSSAGAIEFTARLRGIDTSSGFEAADLFSAVLIIDGDTVNPVHTTDASDLDDPRDGLEGAEIVGAGGTVSLPTVVTHTLRYVIPATANSVQLVITGFNNSANESMVLDQVLFQPYVGPVDTDSDGIPDAYETANGLNPGSNADRDTDLDGDGQSNYNEFLAGTAANDGASTLRVLTIQPNGTLDQFEVTFSTVIGKKYRLQESTDLGAVDAWTNIPGIVTAVADTATLTATLPGPGMHFVRAVVVP